VFREHYKQLGSPLVCRVRRGQLRPRDSETSTKRMRTTNPSPRRRWNAQSRTIQLATPDLKSELIKAGGSALNRSASELGGNWRPCPQRGRKVIVNLFKAGHTAARELQDHPGINLPQDVYKHALRKRMESRARGSGGVQKKDPAQTTCSCSRASSKRLARPTKLSMRSFWTRKAYDTV
jgi:hypothetical protein